MLPFSKRFRRVAATTAAMTSGMAGLLALPAGQADALGSSPQPPVSVFAVVAGNEPAGVYTELSSLAQFSSPALDMPAHLRHDAPGRYSVFFSGPDIGTVPTAGVHVRAVTGGNCMPFDGITPSRHPGLQIDIACFDSAGRPADRRFTLDYNAHGTTHGALVSASTTSAPVSSDWHVAAPQEGGGTTRVTYSHTAPGQYTFDLPYLSGAAPESFAVTALAPLAQADTGEVPDVVCGTTARTLAAGDAGPVRRVWVSCRDAVSGLPAPAATRVNISYVRGVNLAGASGVKEAYFTAPRTVGNTPVVLDDEAVHNPVAGAVTLQRNAVGSYTVDIANQQSDVGYASVVATANGSAALCSASVPDQSRPGHVSVNCRDSAGFTDTGFQLHFVSQRLSFRLPSL